MRGALARATLTSLAVLTAAPAASQPSAGVSLNESFAGFLAQHFAASRESAPDASYLEAWHDLNGDGREEVLVYMNAPIWCGPHSCDLFVFTPTRDGWRLAFEISIAAPPISVLERRTNGWNDLNVYVSTSLMPGEQTRLSYDGQNYVSSRRRLAGPNDGRPLILRDTPSQPLFERRPTRHR